MPPEKLDAQAFDEQSSVEFQLLTSLLRRGGGWFANTSVSPLRRGVELLIDRSITMMLSHARLPSLWLSFIRLGIQSHA